MTAEIGILNKTGVALAADSVATLGSNNKHIIVQKLFDLSKYHSVGIMVYNNSSFSEIPWEIVINVYKSYIIARQFDTLQGYAEDFLKFLSNDKMVYNSNYEKELVIKVLNNCLSENIVELRYSQGQKRNLSDYVESKIKEFSQKKFLEGFDDKFIMLFLQKHRQYLKKYMNEIVNIKLDDKTQENLILLSAYIISKSDYLINDERKTSGIVIAGYGISEIFPSLFEYKIIGVICGKLIFKLNEVVEIYKDLRNNPYFISGSIKPKVAGPIVNDNNPIIINASIRPFAIQDVVLTYLWGVDTIIKQDMSVEINTIFNNFFDKIQTEVNNIQSESNDGITHELLGENREIINKVGLRFLKQITEKFNSLENDKYYYPFTKMLEFLGKEELASLAEAFVNLTCIKYRFTASEEVVGGPIDVAVITKSDGFIWKKRKQIFTPELNIS